MITKIIMVVSILVMVIALLGIGWLAKDVYEDAKYEKKINGLYLSNRDNWTEAKEIAYDLDGGGDWVCINIREMTPKEAVDTCNHEVGHEIFAEYCTDNIEECMEVVK